MRRAEKRKQRQETQKRSKRSVYTSKAKAAGGQDKEGGNACVVDKGSVRRRANDVVRTQRQEVEGKKNISTFPIICWDGGRQEREGKASE